MKVRMQLFPGMYNGLADCGKKIMATEGFGAFFQGLQAGLMRQAVFGTLRIAFFDYGQQRMINTKGEKNITLLDRIGLGMGSGALAMCIANPTDVVKVRFQAEMKGSDPNAKPRYNNALHAFKVIYQEEGFRGFYQSLVPNLLRNSVMNAVELASYSQIKFMCTKGNGYLDLFDEGIKLHLFASSITGVLAVIFGSPFDVTKSRVMNGKMVDGVKVPYSSLMECVREIKAENGVKGFYKGFNANCQRLVSWNVVMFVLREQILTAMRGPAKH